jgi:hypothetical protein
MRVLIASFVFLLSVLPAVADPVVISFSGTATSYPTGGTNEFTLTLTLDNGGTSLSNQQWTRWDVAGVRLTSGSYAADYLPASFAGSSFWIATDASGNILIWGWWVKWTAPEDTIGTSPSPQFYSSILDCYYLTAGNQLIHATSSTMAAISDGSNWTMHGFATVPEPASLFLIAAGCITVGLLRRRIR